MQLKLIDKKGKAKILEGVKRSKFWNHLPLYMEATWIPHIKEDWTYKELVQQVESYEVSKLHIVVPTTTTCTLLYTSCKPYNPDCHRLRNGRQQQKTSFNPSNNIFHNRPAEGNPSKNPNWDTTISNLDKKTKMKLI